MKYASTSWPKKPPKQLICMNKTQLNKYSTHWLLPFRHVTTYMLSRYASCLSPGCTICKQNYKVHIKMEKLHSVVTLDRNSLEESMLACTAG